VWIFFTFWSIRIHVSPTGIVSSLSPLRCRLSSGRRRHTAAPCHVSFPLNQDKLTTSTSSSDNVLSHCLPSQAETKVLNSHHHRRPPSPDRLTPTLHYYKKILSTLVTLLTTQLRLYFASSLVRAPRHRSSTCYHHFFSPLSHTHRPSVQ
jgi:hypothetical protein